MTGPPVGRPLELAAAYAWRLLVVAAAVIALAVALAQVRVPALALALGLLATALLRPPARWLIGRGWRPGAAAGAVVGGALAIAGALLTLIVPPFLTQIDDLGRNVGAGLDRVGDWLTDGPLGLSERQIEEYVREATDQLSANSDALVSGVLSGAQLAGELVVTFALAAVVTFFLVKDGDRIAGWLIGLLPAHRRADGREVGRRCWGALTGYLRGMTIVALFDATFIGAGLVLLDVPAALPLALITFAGAYIPIAGAVVTGLAAVLVALVAHGPATAAIMLLIVLVVQQAESNLLHPLVVGRAVAVHPLAILLAVAVGASVAGIVGAFVAVPLVAVGARVGEWAREAGPV